MPITLAITACNITSTTDSTSAKTIETVKAPFTGTVPVDPNVIKGELSNGIKYLIRKNSKPEKRAEIRLVVNAGSILEDDNQQGFAHFAEHMAFKGTEDFEKHEIIEYVQSIGMKFGAHLNAHTSFDETVYKLQIPTDNKETLEKGIHILENWAHKISFEPEEIDKERGVVIEELRTRHGARSRIMYKQLPVLFKDSRYAERFPIGKKEILAHGSHEDLIRFYKEWYRPELMSLIAVGDIEPTEVEALFKKYFSQIKPAMENPRERKTYGIPDNTAPLISIETDPELTRTIVSFDIKQPLFEPASYQEYRQALKHQLLIGMLNSRYNDYILKPDASVIAGGARFSRSFGDKSQFSISAAVKPGQSKAALAFLLTEVNRVIQHGFNESEFTRQKASIKNGYEKMAKEANNLESRNLAREYVRHFMKDESIPGVIHENEITQHFLPSITLAEINALAKQWFTKENRLIAISGPDSEKPKLPNKQQVLAIWQDVEQQKLEQLAEVKISESLMPNVPKAGSVVDKAYDETLDTHTWTLSNGVKVLLKKTDFKKDNILFSARSEGGFSLADTETFKKAFLSPYIAQMMGVGELSNTDFSKFMKGKSFKVNHNIKKESQVLNGNTSLKDIEHFMQALHLKFKMPRRDKEAYDTIIARLVPWYENQLNSPNGVFKEAIRVKQYSNEPRSFRTDKASITATDLDTSLAFYHQRFSNAANFNFIFVGNLDFVQMEQLVSTYIASLPASLPEESKKLLPDNRNKGELKLTVEKGIDPKATVVMKLYGDSQWSHLENRKFSTLQGVLKNILRERIREEKSGVYGVRVGGSLSKSRNNYSLNISFTCDPLRADELIAEIKTIFGEVQQDLVADKYVKNYIEQELKSLEVNKKKNWFWKDHLTWKAEPKHQPLPIDENESMLKSMTTKDVLASAKHYLNFDDSLIAKLMPEAEVMSKLLAEIANNKATSTAK